MDSSDVSANPCTDVARKMSKARETLANSLSQEERASALGDFETLKDAIAEMQFFSEACIDPDTERI